MRRALLGGAEGVQSAERSARARRTLVEVARGFAAAAPAAGAARRPAPQREGLTLQSVSRPARGELARKRPASLAARDKRATDPRPRAGPPARGPDEAGEAGRAEAGASAKPRHLVASSKIKVSPEEVLFENNHLLVVNKRAGVPSQPDAGVRPGEDMISTVEKYVKDKFRKKGNVFLGLVHRLDRAASGVLCFAKTSKAAARMADNFQTQLVVKEYLCVVEGRLSGYGEVAGGSNYLDHWQSKKEGDWEGRKWGNKRLEQPDGALRWAEVRRCFRLSGAAGRASRGSAPGEPEVFTLLAVQIETGRKHQIRRQLARLGHPIVGDKLYGSVHKLPRPYDDIAADPIMLHATSLTFPNPIKPDPTMTAKRQRETSLDIRVRSLPPRFWRDYINTLSIPDLDPRESFYDHACKLADDGALYTETDDPLAPVGSTARKEQEAAKEAEAKALAKAVSEGALQLEDWEATRRARARKAREAREAAAANQQPEQGGQGEDGGKDEAGDKDEDADEASERDDGSRGFHQTSGRRPDKTDSEYEQYLKWAEGEQARPPKGAKMNGVAAINPFGALATGETVPEERDDPGRGRRDDRRESSFGEHRGSSYSREWSDESPAGRGHRDDRRESSYGERRGSSYGREWSDEGPAGRGHRDDRRESSYGERRGSAYNRDASPRGRRSSGASDDDGAPRRFRTDRGDNYKNMWAERDGRSRFGGGGASWRSSSNSSSSMRPPNRPSRGNSKGSSGGTRNSSFGRGGGSADRPRGDGSKSGGVAGRERRL